MSCLLLWRKVRRAFALALSAGAAFSSAGCVERLLQIRSDPPGAEVFLNGERVGLTPLDHRFDFYGTFDVTLRSSGHLSVRRLQAVHPPWYELPPLDFICENVVPFKIRDRREVRFVLEPARSLDDDEEMAREKKATLDRIRALQEKATSPEGASPQ